MSPGGIHTAGCARDRFVAALKTAGDASSLTQHGPRYWGRIADAILARWTLAEGFAVGYIVRGEDDQVDGIPVDEDDELMFDMWSYRHHSTLDQARRDLAKAKVDEQALTDAEEPDERLKVYALTEIGEENE